MFMERRRPGRKSKGVRVAYSVRFPEDQYARYTAEAHAKGLALGDYVVLRLSELHNLDIPDYVERELGANQLKLGA